jgi:DNA-binding PadR family transcriptional regulator
MDKANLFGAVIDLLVLTTLRAGPADASAIMTALETYAGESIAPPQGALHPSLYRLEQRRFIESEWRYGETRKRSIYYQLTGLGRSRLMQETLTWRRFANKIDAVLTELEPV